MEEIWKPVVGYEGYYEVSNIGRVRSVKRIIVRSNGSPMNVPEKILKPCLCKRSKNCIGYYGVNLHRLGAGKSRDIHRMVAEAFMEYFDKTKMVDHIDQNSQNNNISNLRMATPSENLMNAKRGKTRYLKGASKVGNRWRARLCLNKNKEIRKNIHLGYFDTEQEAHEAYRKKATELFGEFADNNYRSD
jgi:hypothetical protein